MSLAIDQLTHSDPSNALQLSQRAPILLSKAAPASDFFPLSLLSTPETTETWIDHERLFYACLRTGDDKSSHLLLERLTQRFGADDDRIMGLRGLYQEAVARDENDIRKVLLEYNKILSEYPMNIPIHKRRIALTRSLKQNQEAIAALVDFLESFPTDAEAWCELSDLYQAQGMSAQAIFSLEEALLSAPFAWNLHAHLGELEFLTASATTEPTEGSQGHLSNAIQRFSRSVELCDDYLRGYYGLKLASSKFLHTGSHAKHNASERPQRETVQRLHDMATKKLKLIVKQWSAQRLPDVNQSEIIAAQELLDRSKA